MSQPLILDPFDEVLDDFRQGRFIILVDDEDRENEGDLVMATDCITPEAVAFMLREARGLICISISQELAHQLNLPLQVLNNNSPFQTAFAVSVDYAPVGADGVTAHGRAATMRALVAEGARSEDFSSPGAVFPLIANSAGVLGRLGQTEGSFDLARIAGFKASGVICEILNSDGSMARGAALRAFADKHGLKITSIAELIKYRRTREIFVREAATASLKTDYGRFETVVFQDDVLGREHLALVYGDIAAVGTPLARVHSECLTGDVFGSRRCDCGQQLEAAMNQIVAAGAGVILYLRQEGRGIGLANKIKAYALQDKGRDTVEANAELGFLPDLRDFTVAVQIFSKLKVTAVRLLTNNPEKVATLERLGVKVSERVPLVVPPDEFSAGYMATKRDKLGHWL